MVRKWPRSRWAAGLAGPRSDCPQLLPTPAMVITHGRVVHLPRPVPRLGPVLARAHSSNVGVAGARIRFSQSTARPRRVVRASRRMPLPAALWVGLGSSATTWPRWETSHRDLPLADRRRRIGSFGSATDDGRPAASTFSAPPIPEETEPGEEARGKPGRGGGRHRCRGQAGADPKGSAQGAAAAARGRDRGRCRSPARHRGASP